MLFSKVNYVPMPKLYFRGQVMRIRIITTNRHRENSTDDNIPLTRVDRRGGDDGSFGTDLGRLKKKIRIVI